MEQKVISKCISDIHFTSTSLFLVDQKPPVGSYKLNYYDIEKKVNQEPEDPDIKIKVPNLGFNTSEARF